MAIEHFLNETASQLSDHGVRKLKEKMQEGDLAIFFRNNHFMTLTRHGDQLYTLATGTLTLPFLRHSGVACLAFCPGCGDVEAHRGPCIRSTPNFVPSPTQTKDI